MRAEEAAGSWKFIERRVMMDRPFKLPEMQ
jgi:hypothetical protein